MWIDPDGVQTTLEVDWEVSGRGMPPVQFDEEGVPGQPGLRLREVRHAAREFVLPVWIEGVSESAQWTTQRALIASMDPTRGDGIIRVTTVAGDQREIACRYAAGLELKESLGDSTALYAQTCPIVFRAHHPYWRDTADTVTTWTSGSAPGGFFPFAGFPSLSSSEIFSQDTVVNAGAVDTWPVWTVMGPVTDLTAKNLTTDKLWKLEVAISIGEVLTVDTRSGLESVTTSFGNNLHPLLTATSELWSLRRGNNTVRVEGSSTDGDTQVQLSRRHYYLSL